MAERLFSKRTLYALCGLALMWIDWSRNALPGAYWVGTINCIGVVVGIIAISAAFEEYNKPIYYIWTAIMMVLMVVANKWWWNHQAAILVYKLFSIVANVWFLGYPLIHFAGDIIWKRRQIRISKWEIPVILLFLCMFFSVNEDVWPLWFLLMFLILRHTDFSEENRKQLLDGLVDGIILGFFCLQGSATLFRPFDSIWFRYVGIYINENTNALFYLVVWIALLFRLYQFRKAHSSLWRRAVILLLSTFVAGFIMLTVTRTAQLVWLVFGLIYLITADVILLRGPIWKLFGKLVVYLALSLVMIPISYSVARYGPTVLHEPIFFEGEYKTKLVRRSDAADSENYVSWEEFSDTLVERTDAMWSVFGGLLGNLVQDEEIQEEEREAESQKMLSEHSAYELSGYVRLEMWKYYISNGTWYGHSNEDGHKPGLYGQDWYVYHSHNLFVQIWYYYGIPSACLLLVCIAEGLFFGVLSLKKGKQLCLISAYYLLLFAGYGMLESVWYPGQMVLSMVLLSSAAFFGQKETMHEKTKEYGDEFNSMVSPAISD